MFGRLKKGHSSDLVGYAGFMIGAGIDAVGDIKTDEDVYIDGNFKGSIVTIGVVELDKNSTFTGTISSRATNIEGRAKADILASDNIYISGCGQLSGSAKSKNISVDSGALLDAKLTAGN